MWVSVLKVLGYFFGIVAGVSLVVGVVLRLAIGPWGPFMLGLRPESYISFAQACFLFAIALGLGALLEERTKEKK